MSKQDDFVKRSYDTFAHIDNERLRNYNQTMMSLSIIEDVGPGYANRYLNLLSAEDVAGVRATLLLIKQYGKEEVSRLMGLEVAA